MNWSEEMGDMVERLRTDALADDGIAGGEIECLRAESDISDALLKEARAENERLRAALRKITDECAGYTLESDVAFRCYDIARRALEGK